MDGDTASACRCPERLGNQNTRGSRDQRSMEWKQVKARSQEMLTTVKCRQHHHGQQKSADQNPDPEVLFLSAPVAVVAASTVAQPPRSGPSLLFGKAHHHFSGAKSGRPTCRHRQYLSSSSVHPPHPPHSHHHHHHNRPLSLGRLFCLRLPGKTYRLYRLSQWRVFSLKIVLFWFSSSSQTSVIRRFSQVFCLPFPNLYSLLTLLNLLLLMLLLALRLNWETELSGGRSGGACYHKNRFLTILFLLKCLY